MKTSFSHIIYIKKFKPSSSLWQWLNSYLEILEAGFAMVQHCKLRPLGQVGYPK